MTHFTKGISKVQQWTARESKEMLKQFLPLVVGDVKPELRKPITSAVEFIYRAHSSTMTDTDLKELDDTLETFHRLKNLMVNEGFYESSACFDKIPKIHMLGHYSHSIRQLGTPDGYSTEAPEHLHIEYAKDPWRASNKVRPLPQMTTYIQWLEAIRIHRAMTNQWLASKGKPPMARVDILDGREDQDGREIKVEDKCRPVEMSAVTRLIEGATVDAANGTEGFAQDNRDVEAVDIKGVGFGDGNGSKTASEANTYHPDPIQKMAKHPTMPYSRVQDVISDYGASDLKSAVADFLNRRFEVTGYNTIMSENHGINIWHRLYLHHPPPPFAPLDPPRRDVVRASPTSLDDAGRPRKNGVWDVAMYLERPNRRACARNDLEKRGLYRYWAGRVRTFFTLPPGLSRYHSGQLAYLELFTPFNAGASPTHGLHSTSWDLTSTGARRTLVLPVTDIVFACHLSPKFHLLNKELKLSAQTDLFAISQHFWFNHYYSHYMYQLVRHWRREPQTSQLLKRLLSYTRSSLTQPQYPDPLANPDAALIREPPRLGNNVVVSRV
ncbi:hypothetical protein RhiLY_05959 [Ceratobasidium sp. AG-Ba]|nr:hypothetical protein RhiLY_05959 [Ceratobasidium sp. AG-Ba]